MLFCFHIHDVILIRPPSEREQCCVYCVPNFNRSHKVISTNSLSFLILRLLFLQPKDNFSVQEMPLPNLARDNISGRYSVIQNRNILLHFLPRHPPAAPVVKDHRHHLTFPYLSRSCQPDAVLYSLSGDAAQKSSHLPHLNGS